MLHICVVCSVANMNSSSSFTFLTFFLFLFFVLICYKIAQCSLLCRNRNTPLCLATKVDYPLFFNATPWLCLRLEGPFLCVSTYRVSNVLSRASSSNPSSTSSPKWWSSIHIMLANTTMSSSHTGTFKHVNWSGNAFVLSMWSNKLSLSCILHKLLHIHNAQVKPFWTLYTSNPLK